jgi:hypothetical protein
MKRYQDTRIIGRDVPVSVSRGRRMDGEMIGKCYKCGCAIEHNIRCEKCSRNIVRRHHAEVKDEAEVREEIVIAFPKSELPRVWELVKILGLDDQIIG